MRHAWPCRFAPVQEDKAARALMAWAAVSVAWTPHNACMEVCSFASFLFFSSCFRVHQHQVGGVQTTEYSVRATIVLQDRMFFCFDRAARGWMWGACACGVSNSAGLSSASACVQEQDACICFNCLYPCKSQTLREFLLVFYYTHGRACTHSYIHIYIRLLLKISFTYYRNYYTRIHTQLYIQSNGNNETLNEMYSGKTINWKYCF